MSVIDVTPSGVPGRRALRYVTTSKAPAKYKESGAVRYVVHVPASAPPEIQVQLELGEEEAGVWAHIPELDVSAEGADAAEALSNILCAAREWLAYIREEGPQLAPQLAEQQRYVGLLDAEAFSWFKSFRFADANGD